MTVLTRLGIVSNYYGGIYAYKDNNRYYWFIENHDTDLSDLYLEDMTEITKESYENLLKIEEVVK